ncbi:prepilin-type N-terminal cleavage/methylation domain-containing protein [bacterium]|nr:prepilin-type N-terminal cleavage/methylation domain-containing protein [bacterium]
MKINKNSGFTLAELLVSIAVFSILMIVTYNLFVGGNKQYIQGKNVVESISNIRIILAYLKKDIDMMVVLKTEDNGGTRKITIENASSDVVEWIWTKKEKLLERIPQGAIFGNKVSWGGIKDWLVHHVARYYDKVGGESGAPIGNTSVTQFEVFEIDLSKYEDLSHYSEFHGIKVKLIAALPKQKREIFLSRYLFPVTAVKRKVIKAE